MKEAKRATAWLAVPLWMLALACERPSDDADVADEVDVASEAASLTPARLREQPSDADLERMRGYAAEADAVFVGEVLSIEHQLSEPDDDGRQLPFTLVTWRIAHGIKGVSTDETYAARFLGGPIGDQTMVVDEIPEFHTGDRDLLFIEGNGRLGCPLVDGAHGRVQLHASDGRFDGLSPSGLAPSWVVHVTASIRTDGLDRAPAAPRLATAEPFTFAWPKTATAEQMRAAHERTSNHD